MTLSSNVVRNCEVSVSSKKPSSGVSLETRFLNTLGRVTSNAEKKTELLIALSGGVDSVVLLSLAAGLDKQNLCSVRAVYVDHGLQKQSVAWGDHCASLCETLAVSFEFVAVDVDLQSGLSPESAARDARYSAMKTMLRADEYLCTAHHAEDQAETLLLQLFRGAGINGLASMPEVRDFGAGYLFRPLLQASQSEIIDYAKLRNLSWVEDPSNTDLRYDRNFLRHELLPMIEQRWPQVAQRISRSAAHCAEAVVLTSELAVKDFLSRDANSHDVNSKVISSHDVNLLGKMSVSQIRSLSHVRQKNLLRHWISSQGFQTPSTVQLEQLLKDLVHGKEEGQGCVAFGAAEVARYQDNLCLAKRGSFDSLADFEYQWVCSDVPLFIAELDWQLDAVARDNLKPFIGKTLVVRNRRGGERWRPDPAGRSTSVKSMLQQRGVPPWLRSRILFVFHDQVLVDICGPNFEL